MTSSTTSPIPIPLPIGHPLAKTNFVVEFASHGSITNRVGTGQLSRRGKAFIRTVQACAGRYGFLELRCYEGVLYVTPRNGMRATQPELFLSEALALNFG